MPRCRTRSRLTIWVAGVGAAVLLHGVARGASGPAEAGTLSVCIDSASATQARDQTVAEAVARRAGIVLSVHHFDGAGDDDGFTAKQFRALLDGQCELVLGYPIDSTGGEPPAGLHATQPYDQTGFVLVTADPLASNNLAALPRETEVAVTYGTVPNLYFVSHRNITADIHLSDGETLKALTDGHVKAAMVWQPTIAQYLAGHGQAPFSFHPLAEPHARWNIVALYGPAGEAAAARFQAGLAVPKPRDLPAPARSGAAERRFGWYGAPGFGQVQLAAEVNGGVDSGGVPALYTAAQAQAGAAKYSDDCAQCHGDKLQGQAGPALSGVLFASVKTGFSVGDILTFMSINMPATQPASLTHDDYTDIMAYILSQNGFPAGQAALTFDGGSQSKVPLLYHGK